MDKTDVLLYLVLVVFVAVVHCAVLWRGYFAASLRVAVLALEFELAELESAASSDDRTPIRLFRDRLALARRNAAIVGWSRCLAAMLLVKDQGEAAGQLNSRRMLMTVGSVEHRERALGIHRRFEDAMLRRIAGWPFSWFLQRWTATDPGSLLTGATAMDKLIATLPPYSSSR